MSTARRLGLLIDGIVLAIFIAYALLEAAGWH